MNELPLQSTLHPVSIFRKFSMKCALWDILRGMPYKGDDFTIIRPLYFRNIPHGQNTVFTEYVDKICSIFQRAQRQGILSINIKYTDDNAGDLSDYLV